jgi:hypothetical protein
MASRTPPPKRRQAAYGLAKRMDPGGRISDRDVSRARKLITKTLKKTGKPKKPMKTRRVKNPDPTWSDVY